MRIADIEIQSWAKIVGSLGSLVQMIWLVKVKMALQSQEPVYSENLSNFGPLNLHNHEICTSGHIALTFFKFLKKNGSLFQLVQNLWLVEVSFLAWMSWKYFGLNKVKSLHTYGRRFSIIGQLADQVNTFICIYSYELSKFYWIWWMFN